MNGAILTGAQAQQLDSKTDDGNPLGGNIQISLNAALILDTFPTTARIDQGCANTTNVSGAIVTGAYNLSNTSPACALQFATGLK